LKAIETLFHAEPGSAEGEKLEVLVTLVKMYENKNYKIPLTDPIEAIAFHMERLGLTRKNLEPFIGNCARVSEILNRKRPLSLRLIRSLGKAAVPEPIPQGSISISIHSSFSYAFSCSTFTKPIW
jgi:HTH-type transcriptional regulator/antitoxin HigA